SARNVDGETKYSQQGKFETRLSAVVLDVKPNGALLIEGRRTIHLDGDVKMMRVRGLVRPGAIGSDNAGSNDRIADADIVYDSEGGRSNVVHKNWFEKLLDVIWPFCPEPPRCSPRSSSPCSCRTRRPGRSRSRSRCRRRTGR